MYEPGNQNRLSFEDADLDRLLQELKVDQEYSPRPGFYSRVLDRVDASKGSSIWTAFLEPWFGRRLAVASAVLMLLMGVALLYPGSEFDEEINGDSSARAMLVAEGGQTAGPDAVLVNLVTYQER